MAEPILAFTAKDSGALTVTTNHPDLTNFNGKGALIHLNITAVSGTSPTLVVKVQTKDPVSGQYVDVPSGAFASKTATGSDSLLIYPEATPVANRVISAGLGSVFRLVSTIGGTTPSFTYSLAVELIG